jgi:transcriptional regulator with XRE-family HTH domain
MSKGSQLKKLRETLGLSQQALSNLLGMSMQAVWRWEHDKFEFDPSLLELIPILHSGKVPDWCGPTKKSGFDVAALSQHAKSCEDCSLVLRYLELKTK